MVAGDLISPANDVETGAYWAAAARGELIIRHCRSCGEGHHYPRAICPLCFSDATEWRRVSGRGRIYSYSVLRRTPEPYAIAYVTLEEGVAMMTNIVDCDLDRLEVGQEVGVVFRALDDGLVAPIFTPD